MRKVDRLSTILYVSSRAYSGYTLFAPISSNIVWLVDMRGRFVHRWETPYEPGMHGILLPNGHLLYAGKVDGGPFAEEFGIGAGGVLVEYDWEGNEMWRHEDLSMHHDFFRLENGNTMVLRWVTVPEEKARKINGGIPGTEYGGSIMRTDSFQEVDRDGNVVWEWYAYDHLDPDRHIICPLCSRHEWTHMNSCFVLTDGDIMTTSFNLNRIFIIDRATGAIKWEWGEGQLAHPHNPTLLDNGNILVFDNGSHRGPSPISFSRVLEISRETGEIVWEYTDPCPSSFYSAIKSGAQRLPNGNTLICESTKGRFFEVTKDGEIVWEYINPFFNYGNVAGFGYNNMAFRAHRYCPDYPGFKEVVFRPEKFDFWNRIYAWEL